VSVLVALAPRERYPPRMGTLRQYVSGVAAKGMLSPPAYAIVTGAAMVALAWILWPFHGDDAAAGPVAVGFALLGVVLILRGDRDARRRRAALRHEPTP
jgi:hypothetical protein